MEELKEQDEQVIQYLTKKVNHSFYEFCWNIGYYTGVVFKRYNLIQKTPTTQNDQKFSQELHELIVSKLKIYDLDIPNYVLNKLNDEMYKLFKCTLASNRTPDEIIYEIQHNIDIREEVVNLLLSETGIITFLEEQRKFLNRLLSEDDDLKILLNRQQCKEGFPYNI